MKVYAFWRKINLKSKKSVAYITLLFGAALLLCIFIVYTARNKSDKNTNQTVSKKEQTEKIRKSIPLREPVIKETSPPRGGNIQEYMRLYDLAVEAQKQGNLPLAKQYATQASSISQDFTNSQVVAIQDISTREDNLYQIRSSK